MTEAAGPQAGSLREGFEFQPVEFSITQDDIVRYLDAVGDETPVFAPVRGPDADGRAMVPPMAVATHAIRAVLTQFSLRPGSIHASQEVSFLAGVHVGDRLTYRARIAHSTARGGWRYVSIDIEADRQDGIQVFQGRASLVMPV